MNNTVIGNYKGLGSFPHQFSLATIQSFVPIKIYVIFRFTIARQSKLTGTACNQNYFGNFVFHCGARS